MNIEGISPKFHRNTTSYFLVVPDTVDAIGVTAVAEEANAKVDVSGNSNLNIGMNKISIVVTAPDGKSKKTYTISVTKTANLNDANANLENLAVENLILVPDFNADNTEYNLAISSDVERLNILAVPQVLRCRCNYCRS